MSTDQRLEKLEKELAIVTARAIYAEDAIRQAVNGNLCVIGIHEYHYAGKINVYTSILECKCGKTKKERIGD